MAALLDQNRKITKAIDDNKSSPAFKTILVSSAFHMATAQRFFEQVGFQAFTGSKLTLLRFFRSADALSQTEMAWR